MKWRGSRKKPSLSLLVDPLLISSFRNISLLKIGERNYHLENNQSPNRFAVNQLKTQYLENGGRDQFRLIS